MKLFSFYTFGLGLVCILCGHDELLAKHHHHNSHHGQHSPKKEKRLALPSVKRSPGIMQFKSYKSAERYMERKGWTPHVILDGHEPIPRYLFPLEKK